MSGNCIGQLLGLTCEERLCCGITTMAAVDESPGGKQATRVPRRRIERIGFASGADKGGETEEGKR